MCLIHIAILPPDQFMFPGLLSVISSLWGQMEHILLVMGTPFSLEIWFVMCKNRPNMFCGGYNIENMF